MKTKFDARLKKKKNEVKYQRAANPDEPTCSECIFKIKGANQCDIVDGHIDPQYVCDLVEINAVDSRYYS